MDWIKGILPYGDRRPWMLQWRSSTWFIIATVSLSMFTDLFLYSMIVPVMPTALVERAGVSHNDRGYWNNALLIAEAVTALVCCPIFGYAVDKVKHRQSPYLLGLILLAVAMAVLTAAHAAAWYLVARAIQGAATAMVSVAGIAIIIDSIERKSLGQALSYSGIATTVGFMLGPLLGGVVYRNGGFYAVFGMAFGIIGLDAFLRMILVEKRVAKRWSSPPPDPEQSEPEQKKSSETSEAPKTTSATSPVASGQERPRTKFAFFMLLKQPRILITLWAVLVGGIVLSAFDATLPIFVEHVFHWDAMGGGLIFLTFTATCIFMPFFGHLADVYGARWIACSGFAAMGPCLACLRFVTHNTLQQKVLLCALLTLIGAGFDFTMPALMVELQCVLDDMEAEEPGVFGDNGATGQGFSLESMAQYGGLALGPLVGGFVETHYGWNAMTLFLGILSVITAIPMLWLSSGRRPEQDSE